MHDSLGQGSASENTLPSEIDLFSAASTALCGLLIVDEEGAILETNDRLCEMLGYAGSGLIGASVTQLVPMSTAQRHQGHLQAYFKRPSMRVMGQDMELDARKSDGSLLPVDISLTPVVRDGKPRVIATVVDASSRRAMESELRKARGYLQSLLDGLPAKIAYWDVDLRNRFANQQYRDWHQIPGESVVGRSMSEVLDRAAYEEGLPHVLKVLEGQPQQFERKLVGEDGRARQVLVNYVPDLSDAVVQGFFVLGTDITRLREVENALNQEQERSGAILNSIGDGVVATDTEGKITYINPVAQQLTGWDEASSLGQPVEDIMDLRDRSTGDAILNPLRIAIRDRRVVALAPNCILRSRTGESYLVEDSAAPIRGLGSDVSGGVIVFHDVSEAHAMAAKMMHFARHDTLTDLPNRLVLRDRLEQLVERARRESHRFAVMYLDLDNFKDINDTFGHAVGDELLKSIAGRISEIIRSSDTVGREGGDEFIVLLDDCHTAAEAGTVSSKLLAAIETPFRIELADNPLEISIGASVGIVMCPSDGEDVDTLLRNANAAMFTAKKEGRKRSHFFSPELGQEVSARRLLLGELHEALANDSFRVVYQPVVNAETGEIVALEALVRWQKSHDHQIAPGEFMDLVEETGLILPLGNWILQDVCSSAVERERRGSPCLPIKVNISPRQFRDPGFVDWVEKILGDSGLDSRWLELEITEGSLMERIPRTSDALQRLRSMGVRIAIDDFGTGYSSLSYLKRLPVDILKVDRAFVKDISADEESRTIVSLICDLAKRLRLEIIAEGIERSDQAQFLVDSGCLLMQGYFFCPPLGARDLEDLLGTWEPEMHRFRPSRP